MEEILEIVNTFEVQTMIRLLLCVLLAGFIGMEREHLKKPAGARTHMLLCISGCLVMLTGEYVSIGSEMADMTRLPAQLLSGIGFIGAGTILKDGSNIKGLTTAASLLCTTCIGLAIGAGFYLGGIIGTIILYVVLTHSYKLYDMWDAKFVDFKLNLKYDGTCDIEKVQAILDKNNYKIGSIKLDDSKKIIMISGKSTEESNKNKMISDLIKKANITEIIEG